MGAGNLFPAEVRASSPGRVWGGSPNICFSQGKNNIRGEKKKWI